MNKTLEQMQAEAFGLPAPEQPIGTVASVNDDGTVTVRIGRPRLRTRMHTSLSMLWNIGPFQAAVHRAGGLRAQVFVDGVWVYEDTLELEDMARNLYGVARQEAVAP